MHPIPAHKPHIVADCHIPFLRGRLEAWASVDYREPSDFTPEAVKEADALIIRTRTRAGEALLAGSKVKAVVTATIGTDQIDIPWCEAHGIAVANAPGCNAPGVAQYVWSALLRRGFDPRGKKIGVVGCGNVGSIVAEWGRLLGAEIIVSDPPRQERGDTLPDGYEYAPLPELLAQADVVTLHTPLTREGDHPTLHLIGEGEIRAMKPQAFFINAARGEVLHTQEALPALREHRGEVFIDTWEGEPLLDPELLARADLATPHIAGYSLEGKQRATHMAIRALDSYFGTRTDTSGLAGPYEGPAWTSPKEIADSYDPWADMASLTAHPEDFEMLRSNYDFRHEPAS